MGVTELLIAALLITVILFDVRVMRLPNWLALAFVAVFIGLISWTLPFDTTLWRVAVAGVVLIIGIALNAARLVGGGDVKVLAALLLLIPTPQLLNFAFLFFICLFVGILALLLLRKIWPNAQTSWRGLRAGERYPMGISIGVAGLVFLGTLGL